ncbi:hypothetical protein [Mongoliitalea lutea]|uniref:Uncharacterized protein n=1 Tax=Mongoliitalea lutea TaxID=849756 RepID=A0A8J3CXC3_9BACT|nr:hypothetical protein [Mongoliitalea lutea]GHB33124.1 hypothetical protein GCM10008106_12550 [Mongoliitalea lutea]
MKTVEINLDESKFNETNELRKRMGMTMAEYVSEALTLYNQSQRRRLLEEKLQFESKLVWKESIKVCREFDKLS